LDKLVDCTTDKGSWTQEVLSGHVQQDSLHSSLGLLAIRSKQRQSKDTEPRQEMKSMTVLSRLKRGFSFTKGITVDHAQSVVRKQPVQ
jgi:hypothetical protein